MSLTSCAELIWRRGQIGPVGFAFTDRTLDLAAGGDEFDRLAAALDVDRLVPMKQVHGRDVAWVELLASAEIPVADALLTGQPGVGILVRVADCTPIVLAAPQEALAAVVHCGREGLVKGVVEASVQALRDRGATEIRAVLGPRACGRCYELPGDMADAVAAVVPESRSTTSWGTAAIDVGAGVMAQLAALGVRSDDIGFGECTIEHDRWFSYRRQGHDSGRFGAVAVIRS